MFQFHNGTINTGESEAYAAPEFSFQFHNGTINTETLVGKDVVVKAVSIPQRYN